MNERRIERLEALIKQRVAEVVDQEIADPHRGFVTITRVKIDRELAHCVVYWSVLGDDRERKRNEGVLRRASSFVQREVAAILHTRTVPRVRFEHDESVAGAARLENLLAEIRSESGEEQPPPADLDKREPGDSLDELDPPE